MSNNIEDIYIGDNYKTPKKKGGKIILFFILIVFMILITIYGVNWYFNNYKTTNTKQLLFTHLSNSNLKSITNENIYKELSNKILSSNYKINSKLNFSTNVENEYLEGLDISKFSFNLDSQNDAINSKKYSELGINYSGNEVLRVKLLTNKDSIGIASDEIVNKYVGIHYNKIKEVLGIDLNQEKIDNVFNIKNNDLTNQEKEEFFSNIISKISNIIPEENFTIKDNIAINKNGESIPVTGYNLSLSQQELNNILVESLKDIKNNEEILNKFVNTANNQNIKIQTNTITSEVEENINNQKINDQELNNQEINNQEINNQEINNQEINNQEINNSEIEINVQNSTNLEPIQAETNNFNETQVIEESEETELQNEEITEPDENIPELELMHSTNLENVEEDDINKELEKINESYEYVELIKLLFGMKINKNLDEIQEILDSCINQVKDATGNGITITVYVSTEKTEKISIVLPNENSIDLEVLKKSDLDNKIKLTYLYKGNNALLNLANMSDEIYSRENNIRENEINSDQTNGISIEIDKANNDSNTSLDITYNIIENEKINKKIKITSEFEGSVSSNFIENSTIVTVSTSENESKLVSEANIKFSENTEIPDLVEDNCLFLETLNEEDYNLTIQAIKDKIKLVWDYKKDQFNFIDTNNRTSSIIKK